MDVYRIIYTDSFSPRRQSVVVKAPNEIKARTYARKFMLPGATILAIHNLG